jgi:DNA-binding GntR family transcriptional regulator
MTQWPEPGWVEESARQHHAMVDALAAGDSAGFRAAVQAHIRPQRHTLARRRRSRAEAAD